MTDNEIIKALECCISGQPCKETKCPFYKKGCEIDIYAVEKYALDLINRQKAEIEKLKEALHECYKSESEVK